MKKKDPNVLNKRERAILRFIEKQIKLKGYPPSVREIGKAVDLKSTATVHGYLNQLEEKGYIKKEQQKGRTLKLLKGGALENQETFEPSNKDLYTEKVLNPDTHISPQPLESVLIGNRQKFCSW